MHRVRVLLGVAAAIVAVQAVDLPAQVPSGFVSIFDGTLKGWVVENTQAGNFRVVEGALRVEGPEGWLRTERHYQDFSLRVEFRFVTPDADSGIFLRASGSAQFIRGWPNNCYQVQIRNPVTESRFPPVGGFFRHGMPAGETNFNESAARHVAKDTGVWQWLEIDLAGQQLTAQLNGVEVLRAGAITPSAGHIGLQGETGVLEYRSIQIREIRQ